MVLPVYEDELGFLSLPSNSSNQRRASSFDIHNHSSSSSPILNLKQLSINIINKMGSGRFPPLPYPPPLPEDHTPHSGKVNKVFNAMRYVLLALGRFPFIASHPSGQFTGKNLDHAETMIGTNYGKSLQLQGRNYSSSIKSWAWVYFGITSLFLVALLVLSIGSFLEVFLSWTFFGVPEWSLEQKTLFEHNLIPFVLVWSCLLSSSVGNISFFLNRRNIVKFLNYWNVAVDNMNVGITDDLKMFLHMSNLWFVIFAVLMAISTKVLPIQFARGGSTLLGVLALRLLISDIDQYEWICRSFGMAIILYAMYASRALLFVFVFKCKLLRHCIKIWNSRLKAELRRENLPPGFAGFNTGTDEEYNCKKLFYDHVILLKLVRLTDKTFAAALLSYFGSQILNMCFELYYVAMSNTRNSLTPASKSNDDGLDTFVAVLLLIQNIYVFLSVSLHASYVCEEANRSYEIVKTKGISATDSLPRRHLILSLQMSFQQRMCLTGGHYFVVDKPFIVRVLGAVFTYFIIILQYGYQLPAATYFETCNTTEIDMNGG